MIKKLLVGFLLLMLFPGCMRRLGVRVPVEDQNGVIYDRVEKVLAYNQSAILAIERLAVSDQRKMEAYMRIIEKDSVIALILAREDAQGKRIEGGAREAIAQFVSIALAGIAAAK